MADRTSTVRVNVITDASGGISGLSKFSRLAGVAALGIGGLAVGGALAATKLYAFGDAADDADASIAQGLRTMKLFGKQTDEVTKRIQEQGEQLSKNTAIDQVTIKNTQAKLLTFKELAKTADTAGGSFDRATQAAVDLAAKGFGTAETNAVQLGKALNDPVNGLTSLSRAGITFTDQEKERIKTLVESNKLGEAQALVLKNIEAQVGGTAAATAGGFELMQNRVKLFGQEIAERALPYLDRFGTFMVEKGGPAIAQFAASVSENVLPKLRQFGGFVQEKVVPVLQDLAGFIVDHLVPAYSKVLAGAVEGARGFLQNLSKQVDGNRGDFEDFGDKVKKVATIFTDKILPVVGDFYRETLPKLGTALGIAIQWIAFTWSNFNRLLDIIQKVAAGLQAVIDKANQLKHSNLGTVASAIPGVGALGALTQRTAGGDAAAPPVTVNVPNGFVGDEVALARTIADLLATDARRFGPVTV